MPSGCAAGTSACQPGRGRWCRCGEPVEPAEHFGHEGVEAFLGEEFWNQAVALVPDLFSGFGGRGSAHGGVGFEDVERSFPAGKLGGEAVEDFGKDLPAVRPIELGEPWRPFWRSWSPSEGSSARAARCPARLEGSSRSISSAGVVDRSRRPGRSG